MKWRPNDTIGASGLKHSGGFVYEEFLRNLAGTRAVQVYREMRDNSAIVGAILYVLFALIRQVRFYPEVPQGMENDAEAKAARDFVAESLAGMSRSWNDLLSEILSMLVYGWALFEITYRKDESGRLTWGSIDLRAQDTLDRWQINEETGEIEAFIQNAPPRFRTVTIPMGKCILFRTETTRNNPEGRSLLRNAYRSWYYQSQLEEIEAIGMERDLAGVPVLEVPPAMLEAGDSLPAELRSLKADLYKMVRRIRRNENEGIVMPAEDLPLSAGGGKSGYRLRLLSSGGTRSLDISGAIRRHQTDIAMTMLGEFILLGTGPTGSFALASDKTDMFALATESWVDVIAETFTQQAIRPLMDMNGIPKEKWPVMRHDPIETPALAEISTAISHMVTAGIVRVDETLENQIRKWAGLPPAEPGAVNMALATAPKDKVPGPGED